MRRLDHARPASPTSITRERRLDAAPGILIPPLAWWTERVQDSVAHGDFGELVGTLRSGPPFWSPLALPPLRAVDVQEFFIHHEDVRRAQVRLVAPSAGRGARPPCCGAWPASSAA